MTTVTIELEQLMIDPARVGRASSPVDEAQVERLVDALAEGETLPPLRVAPIADPLAEWCGCPQHWERRRREAWAVEVRLADTNRPFEPQFALYDGLARAIALQRYIARTEPRRRRAVTFECLVDEASVASLRELQVRALAANLRNGREVTDRDLRLRFEVLWLGHPAKSRYERFTVDPHGGCSDPEILGRELGRSAAWAQRMMTYCELVYALDGRELSKGKAEVLARIEAGRERENWRRFCLMSDGSPRFYHLLDAELRYRYDVEPHSVFEMTCGDLARVVEHHLATLMTEVSATGAGQTDAVLDDEPEADEKGQYSLPFEVPYDEFLPKFKPLQDVASQLPPQRAFEEYYRLAPTLLALTKTADVLRKRAREGGLQID